MSQISYSLAGVTPPGSGTPNDNAFFLALFNALFAAHNDTDATVAAATPNATANALVKRGTQGEANLGYFAVVPPAPSTSPAAQILLPAGHTGLGWYVSLAGAMTSQMDAFGNLTMGGTIKAGSGATLITDATGHLLAGALAGIVGAANGGTGAASPAAHGVLIGQGAGAMTTVAPGTAGNLLTSNGTDWASAPFALPAGFTLPYTQIADYKPGVNAATATIGVAAGGAYIDSTGAYVAATGQATVGLANAVSGVQPSGTNIQNVAISKAPGGSLVATGGTVAAAGTASVPLVPVGNAGVALVIWRGATTNPGNVVAAVDIADARGPGGVGAGTGTGGGIPTTTAFVSVGDLRGTYANSLPLGLAAGSIGGSLVAGSGVLADSWSVYERPDIEARLTASGATVTLAAGAGNSFPGGNNYTYGFGGMLRTLTANATATASGPAGQRTLVLDANPANPALTLMATVVLNATQYPVASYYWDGAALYDNGVAAFKAMAWGMGTPSVKVTPVVIATNTDQASSTYTAWSIAPNMPDGGFANGATANVKITFRVRATITTTGVSASIECQAVVDGTNVPEADAGDAIPSTVTSPMTKEVWLQGSGWLRSVASGSHSFGLRYSTANCTVVLHSRTATAEVWGQ